jgi:ribosomal protein S18 acetylase RimI-like enzyme
MTEPVDYLLRPLTRADEPFLWEMLYHAIYVPEGTPPPPRDIVNEPELSRYVSGWGGPDDFGLMAVDAKTGRPVGAVWLRLMAGDNRGYGYVDGRTPELSMAVLPEHRGRGVGTRLLCDVLESAAGKHGAVSLSVSVDNPARRLYERSGFEAVELSGSSLTMVKRFGGARRAET